jgi:hypothetical protein
LFPNSKWIEKIWRLDSSFLCSLRAGSFLLRQSHQAKMPDDQMTPHIQIPRLEQQVVMVVDQMMSPMHPVIKEPRRSSLCIAQENG